MTRLLSVLLVVVVVVTPALLPAGERTSEAKVVKVLDGDSLVVKQQRKWLTIRLYGIDAPEYGQPYGSQSKQYLRNRVLGKQVSVTSYYQDSYGRTVAQVKDASGNVNASLVAAGLAWVYPRYCRKNFCTSWRDLQDEAKQLNKGLWRAPDPVPPWLWKRRQRQH